MEVFHGFKQVQLLVIFRFDGRLTLMHRPQFVLVGSSMPPAVNRDPLHGILSACLLMAQTA